MAIRDYQDELNKGMPCPDHLLQIALAGHQDILVELNEMKEAVMSCDKYSEAEAKSIVLAITKRIQNVYEERKRLDEFAKKHGAENTDDGLDFDALRLEIGRRLDELRSTRGSGKVSETPE